MEIRNIDYGVAFTVNDKGKTYIEMNKDLEEDPVLYTAVLGHELEHCDSNKLIDFWLDLKPKWYSWRLFRWSMRHPRSWYAISPVFFDERKASVNLLMLVYWTIVFIFIPIALWFMLF